MTLDEKQSQIEEILAGRVQAAATLLQVQIKQNISTSSKPSRSSPGEYPHRDTEQLIDSIDTDLDAATLTARIGSLVPHAKFLEFGTEKMAARPWLRRTLNETKSEIARTITGK